MRVLITEFGDYMVMELSFRLGKDYILTIIRTVLFAFLQVYL